MEILVFLQQTRFDLIYKYTIRPQMQITPSGS